MSYKQFIQELEDDVSPVEAQSRCVVLDFLLFLVQISGRHIFQLKPDFVPFHLKNHFCYVYGTLYVCCVWYTFCIAVWKFDILVHYTYRYEEYKSEYITTQKKAYFDIHKDEDW